jgi:hypothetical protein
VITTILDLIYEFVSLKREGKDTIECRRKFAKALTAFIDFRVGADEKELKIDSMSLIARAPEPGSDNFDEEYEKWYKQSRELF